MIELTLEMAERASRAAREKAKALGTPMTITVVDEAGRLVLCSRGDGTGFFTPETSRAKAMAAANFRMSTADLADRVQKGSPFWAQVGSAVPGQLLASHGAPPASIGYRAPFFQALSIRYGAGPCPTCSRSPCDGPHAPRICHPRARMCRAPPRGR